MTAITAASSAGSAVGPHGERAVPAWMEARPNRMRILIHSLPTREQITVDVAEQLIVELYSK